MIYDESDASRRAVVYCLRYACAMDTAATHFGTRDSFIADTKNASETIKYFLKNYL